jgi:hypothetical protein
MYQQFLRLRQSCRIASAPTAARRARRLLGWRLKRDCEIDLSFRSAPAISGIFRPNLGEIPLFFGQGNGSTTPRGGAVTLSDVREPALVIVWESCERRGRYNDSWITRFLPRKPLIV